MSICAIGANKRLRGCLDREVEALIPWASSWETFLKGARHQRLDR